MVLEGQGQLGDNPNPPQTYELWKKEPASLSVAYVDADKTQTQAKTHDELWNAQGRLTRRLKEGNRCEIGRGWKTWNEPRYPLDRKPLVGWLVYVSPFLIPCISRTAKVLLRTVLNVVS